MPRRWSAASSSIRPTTPLTRPPRPQPSAERAKARRGPSPNRESIAEKQGIIYFLDGTGFAK
jgi:hypothetical protein